MIQGQKLKKRMLSDLTLLLGSMITATAGTTIAPALPKIHATFQQLPHAIYLVKFILTLPALFIGLGAYFFGYLLDRWGRKPVLIVSLTLFGLAGSSGYYLNSLYLILVARAFQGLAVAGILTGFTTLIADFFVDRHLARFMGLQVSFMTFGGVIFLIFGGVLADVEWNYPFLLFLISFAVLPALLVFVKEPKTSQKKTATGPTGSLRSPPRIVTIFVYLCAFLGMVIFFMVPTQLPFHLKKVLDISSTSIGFAIATKIFFAGLSSIFYPKLKSHLSFKVMFILAFTLLGFGFFILAASVSYYQFVLGLSLGGIGFGLFLPNLNLWVVSSVPANIRGRAIGSLATAIFLGQFFSPILTQPVIDELEMHHSLAMAGGVLTFIAFLFVILELVFLKRVQGDNS